MSPQGEHPSPQCPPSAETLGEGRAAWQGSGPGKRNVPSSCCWNPLFLAALGRAARPSAGFDYSHELKSMLRWRPLHTAAFAGRRHPFSATCQAGAAWGGVHPAGTSPHPPACLQACPGLSSFARLTLGSPGPWPSSRALSEKHPTPQNPSRGPSPSPLTWNPVCPGFYVCREFGKQNA